jgi:hypothetical protein
MKISASIERSYHKRKDGLYQEVISHFVHFEDVMGNKQTKLDRSELGLVYQENTSHNSFAGTVLLKENGVEKRLIVCEKTR